MPMQVFVSIMAEKMKKQQEQQQEQAKRRAAADAKKAEAGTKPDQNKRRSTRKQNEDAKEDNAVEAVHSEKGSKSQEQASKGRGKPKKNTRSSKGIVDYFNKDTINVDNNGPTVQEALQQEAVKYDSKPEGLGAQELNATQQPKLVSGGDMRDYQLEGLEWLKSLWMNDLCGILADEMGLGKTIQAISMIAFFKENNISGPFLVVAPLTTLNNWINEFAHWTPTIKTVLYHGSKQEREELRRKQMKMKDQGSDDFPVVCTSYDISMNDKKYLANYNWRYIVVDEGHRLKNMDCKLIKELIEYRSANRLLITGTPLQNNIEELWSLLHFLLPDVFNDVTSFKKWFDFDSMIDPKATENERATVAEKSRKKLVSSIHAILKPFLLRRVKTDVEDKLPKKREYILYAPLTAEQKELYREIIGGQARSYLEGKAVERIEAKSRTASLKRKANDSGRSTPNGKSTKTSRASTPGSVASTRRGRPAARRQNYADITDREFNSRLRRIENGEADDLSSSNSPTPESETDLSEIEEQARVANLKAAKKEIAHKKLQNPIMQARLACNSPHNFYWPWMSTTEDGDDSTVDESLVAASGKLLLLDCLLPALLEKNHKILIFSQFKTTLDILEAYLQDLREHLTCRIDGSIPHEDRQAQIDAFNNDSDYKIFLLSTRAGGQGINLTAADTVILFDSDWNPQQDLQAMDRAHRIGQTRPVIVYRLATKGTVEEVLLEKAGRKRKLEKLVIRGGRFRGLFDGVERESGGLKGVDPEVLKGVLGGQEWENVDGGGGGDEKDEILSERDLKVLTDRSEEAYRRAEDGQEGEVEGDVFKVRNTEREKGEGGLMEGLEGRK